MGVIFYFSSIPSIKISEGALDILIKKTAHFTEFAVLYILYFKTFLNCKKSIAMAVLYAVSDEIHQSFVPARNPSIMDVGIDSLGIFCAHYLIKFKCLSL